MKKLLLIWLVGMIPSLSVSQGKVAREIGELIQNGKIDEAQQRVDAYLATDPHNVDALMMKGNVLLNKSPEIKDAIVVTANDNESIYDNSIGFIHGSQPTVISKHLALQVAALWREALKYDSTREDIHFGICQIYSMAILTDELIAYLPVLKTHITSDPILYYSMGDYARNMIARDRFDEAMKVYRAISRLYPEQFGVISDIAGEYYQHGDLDSAHASALSLINRPSLDTMSYGNAFFILAVCEDYDNAVKALKMKSKAALKDEYLLYEGLLSFSRNEPSWRKTLQTFSELPCDSIQKAFALALLSVPTNVTPGDYVRLNSMRLNDAYMVLFHRTFAKLLPNEFLPQFNYAEVLTHICSFGKAAAEFAELERSHLSSERTDIEAVAFYHGWVLWKLNDRGSSIALFGKLLDSDDFYYKSAAAYFTGKYYFDMGNRDKAKEYFKLVSDKASESKYATLCWNLLKR